MTATAPFAAAALALCLVAAAVPAAANSRTPSLGASSAPVYHTDNSNLTAVALNPDCPPGLTVKVATTTVYECTQVVPPEHAAGAAYVAGQIGCKYPRYWNSGPDVTLTPVRGKALVRWILSPPLTATGQEASP